MAGKGLFTVAAQYCEGDRELQIGLARQMAAAGQATLAQEFARLWALLPEEVEIDPAALEREETERR